MSSEGPNPSSNQPNEVPIVSDSPQIDNEERSEITDVLTEILEALNKEDTVQSTEINLEELEKINNDVSEALQKAEESIETGKTIGIVGAALGLMNVIAYAFQRFSGQGGGNSSSPLNKDEQEQEQEDRDNKPISKKAASSDARKESSNSKETTNKSSNEQTGEKAQKPNKASESKVSDEKKEKQTSSSNNKGQSKKEAVKDASPLVGDNKYIEKLLLDKYNIALRIVQGKEAKQLFSGHLGHYTHSALPTQREQIILVGYTSTDAFELKNARIDDVISLQTSNGYYQYRVTKLERDYALKAKLVRMLDVEQLIIVFIDPYAPQNRYILYANVLDNEEYVL